MEIFKKFEAGLSFIEPRTLEEKKKIAEYFEQEVQEAQNLVPFYQDQNEGQILAGAAKRALEYVKRRGSLRITNNRNIRRPQSYHQRYR
jgi:hypothetical protein